MNFPLNLNPERRLLSAFELIERQRQVLCLIDEIIGRQYGQEPTDPVPKETKTISLRDVALCGNDLVVLKLKEELENTRVILLEFAQRIYSRNGSFESNSFDEETYLNQNPDVKAAVKEGVLRSGFDHWLLHGLVEARSCHVRSDSNRLETLSSDLRKQVNGRLPNIADLYFLISRVFRKRK